ncbi:MAG TPA: ABC transporter permease [Candidatus Marinimicrobia bacterium]|nr:ABC transporter permease [Candidatus Neomarinimicrobiota bacterium]
MSEKLARYQIALFFAWRYFRTRKKAGMISATSIITLIGVLIGSFAIIASLSVLNGFQEIVINRTLDLEPHARVDIRHLSPHKQDSLLQELEKLPTISTIQTIQERKLIIASSREQQVVFVKGVSPSSYLSTTCLTPYLFHNTFLSDTIDPNVLPEIVIGIGIANYLGLHTGDTLSLISPLDIEDWETPALKCIVSDIFQIDIFDYDKTLAFIHLEDMMYLLDNPSYHFLEITFLNGIKSERAINDLKRLMPDGAEITSWQETHQELFAAMRLEKIGTFIVLNLIIVLAGFNLLASLVMLLLEKRWEIGILKSCGMDNQLVFYIYLWLGFINGFLGLIGGLVISLTLLLWQQFYPFIILPQDVYFIKYLPVNVQFFDLIVTILALMLLIIAASWYPAKRSAELNPLSAIRVKF